MDYPFFKPGFTPTHFDFGSDPATIALRSQLNGSLQTQGMPGKVWMASMTLPAYGRDQWALRQVQEAFFDELNGQAVRVNLWHFGRADATGRRGYPRGTINQSGLQVNANAAQFATSLQIKGAGIGKTLMPGDMVGFGGQLVMVPRSTGILTANGSGVITLPVPAMLDRAMVADEAVTVVRPTAEFVLSDPKFRVAYGIDGAEGFGVDWMMA